MTQTYLRYGIYFAPTGMFAAAGARWLGWDLETGQSVGHPDQSVIKRPQKYGFHGTIKPPFRLAKDRTLPELKAAFERLCVDLPSASVAGLGTARIGRFVALTPLGTVTSLESMAGRVVSELDHFRAEPTDVEIAQRRKPNLTPVQEAHLLEWGYPYIFDQFRFHMTLSGILKGTQLDAVLEQAKSIFIPVIPTPLVIDALSLVGERADGMFELIKRHPLTGS